MTKPLIGVPLSSAITEEDGWRFLEFRGVSTYCRALEQNGSAAIFIPLDLNDEHLRGIYERLDGLLLAGGVDVHPKEYGETVEPFCGVIDDLRDAAELKLTRWALAEQKPLPAICRGIQTLNVAAGGSLYQDIEAQYPDPIPHRTVVNGRPENAPHPIVIEAGSRLARAVGATSIVTNSYHHQALKKIACNLYVSARASDQLPEALETRERDAFVLGVQFHPEIMLDEEPRLHGIFRDFVGACRDSALGAE